VTRPRKTTARRPHKHRKERAAKVLPGEKRRTKGARGDGGLEDPAEDEDPDAHAVPQALPMPSTEAVVVLSRSGVRRLGSGHPWLYDDHIAVASRRDGELVRLEGPVGVDRGAACFSVGSRIPLRVVSREPGFGSSPDWAVMRLDAAIERRRDALAPGEDAYRLVHAEADGLPGLVIDRYADVAVFQAGCRWADAAAPVLARHLVDHHGVAGALARHDGAFRKLENLSEGVTLLAGEVPELVRWRHAGITREVDPWGGQKTGTYLDQRENQPWAAEVLPVGHCLDAFSHDGGFALQLAAAGSHVEALDSSRPALERLERHAAANGLSERITTRTVNVFEDLRDRVAAGEQLDGIVLDPPALAKRKGDLPRALRAYKEANLRAMRLLRPGGRLLTCSCSFHVGREAFLEALRAAAADARREVFVLGIRGAASCHPNLLTFPESDYLKAVLIEVQ
jgi:23S rRNA (cytosine1962-C5)-methyltransferase